ncbi:VOC family protein [Bacillus sp. 2205SS5-2]|uniref:VOC family protein n=1 Tax=Bacillus sp. 2205SS5-2 TaxID=3109031 RepID=UPI003004572D
MAELYPYLFSNDARKQANYYAEALKGKVISVQTFADAPQAKEDIKEKIMHLVLQAAGQKFFIADSITEEVKIGNSMELTLVFPTVEEAHLAFQALSSRGKVLIPFEKMFWGSMFGRLQDPFGVTWQIST